MWGFLRGDPNEPAEDALERSFRRSQAPLGLVGFGTIFAIKLGLFSDPGEFYSSFRILVARTLAGEFTPFRTFASQHGVQALLAIATYFWWRQHIAGISNERKLLYKIYKKLNVRKSIGTILGYNFIPIVSLLITLLFIGMAFLIDDIILYCSIVLIWSMLDIWGNNAIRTTLTEDLWKKQLRPRDDDPHRDFSVDWINVIEDYWIRRPQIQRIGWLMVLTSIALILALPAQALSINAPSFIPYTVMILAIVINEITMFRWRKERDARLTKVEIAQEKASGKTFDEPPDAPPTAK